MDIFESDPRRESHDRKTWELMRPGARFGSDLVLFVRAGRKRASLSMGFRYEVAIWRFAFCNETTAEEKHARVTLEKAHRNLSEVRVSLANRLPMLEKCLVLGVFSFDALVADFESCRNLVAAARMFSFDRHQKVDDILQNPSQRSRHLLRDVLKKVLYRSDLEHLYHSVKPFAKAHDAKDRKQVSLLAKLRIHNGLDEGAIQASPFEVMEKYAMLEHFKRFLDTSQIYSMPRHQMEIQPLHDVLQAPPKRSKAVVAVSADGTMDLVPDIPADGDDDASVDRDLVFFRVVLINPSHKKRVKSSVRGKIEVGQLAISLYSRVAGQSEAEAPLVSAGVTTVQSEIMLMNGLAGSPKLVADHFNLWKSRKLVWTIRDVDDGSVPIENINAVLSDIISLGAYPGVHDTRGFRLCSDSYQGHRDAIHALSTRRLVDCFRWQGGVDAWFLTEKAMKLLVPATRLSDVVSA